MSCCAVCVGVIQGFQKCPTRLVHPQLWLSIGHAVAASWDPRSSNTNGESVYFKILSGSIICVSVCSIFAPLCRNHHWHTDTGPTEGKVRWKKWQKCGTCWPPLLLSVESPTSIQHTTWTVTPYSILCLTATTSLQSNSDDALCVPFNVIYDYQVVDFTPLDTMDVEIKLWLLERSECVIRTVFKIFKNYALN